MLEQKPQPSILDANQFKMSTPGELPALNSLISEFFDGAAAKSYEDHLFELLSDYVLNDNRPNSDKSNMLYIVKIMSELFRGLEKTQVQLTTYKGGSAC